MVIFSLLKERSITRGGLLAKLYVSLENIVEILFIAKDDL